LGTVTDASGATTYSYDAVGNLQNFSYPNGVTHAYSYDGLNRVTQVGSSKNSSPISNYAYTLGAAGNRLTVAELTGRTVNYGYDSLYRLTSEAVTSDPHAINFTNGFTYDAVGNRRQWLVNGVVSNSYTYDPDDRLGSDQYDPNGNTTSSFGVTNAYDFENHMVQKGSVVIVYDGDGDRVSETVGSVTTNYLVDTQNPTGYAQVVDELQSGTVARTYSYGLERISETQSLTGLLTTSFYGYDGHVSVRQLTSSTGAVTDTYDYDAFGNLISQTGTTPNNYLFGAEQYDPTLSLYYNRARYLNTTTGRFLSMDSAEPVTRDPLTLHRYLYGGANPVNNSDPSGLYTQQFGYDVEDEVEKEYTADFGASDLVSFGKWSRVGGSASYRLKPDILDLRISRLAWMDIKPLSISGIGSAAASWGIYTAAFSSFGINPDVTWLQNGRIITVDNLATLVFNCGGIIFF
jgi:RHS repeat-associated protein